MSAKGQGKYAHLGLGPMWARINGKKTKPYRIYRIWARMKERARLVPSVRKRDPTYVELNLTICDEWLDFGVFWKWAVTHGYRDDLTIDRIDNYKGYCPENCRWATLSQQNKNRRMTPKRLTACRRNAAKGGAATAAKYRAEKAKRRAEAEAAK